MGDQKNILMTGASGLIGSTLTGLLIQRGHRVSHLGRMRSASHVPSFIWDPRTKFIESRAFGSIDTLVHLAGSGVAEGRWTTQRKKEILESRTLSTRLLFEALKSGQHRVKNFICASGISYYGPGDALKRFTEEDPVADDFLAYVSKEWEREADQLQQLGIRVVKIRIGVVLSDRGGALPAMVRPVKWFAGAPLGTGTQMVSWIHMNDLCGIFIKAIEEEHLQGVYNATAPNPVTNAELTKAIGRVLHRPVFLPPVPGFMLKLFLGEMVEMVLKGNSVSSEKIQREGYAFKFANLDQALNDLLGRAAIP